MNVKNLKQSLRMPGRNKAKTLQPMTDPNIPSTSSEGILWSSVCRGSAILAEAGTDDHGGQVTATAKGLLEKADTHGWEFFSVRGGHTKIRGMRFHVYDKEELTGDMIVWKFAAVYNCAAVEKDQVQSFLEKLVHITEVQRTDFFNWRYGGVLAAQESFAPVLLQRMQEVAYMGRMAMVQEELGNAKEIMHKNIELAMENDAKAEDLQETATHLEEAAKQFKKRARTVKRFRMWQNAKHGIVVGTLVTGVVAAVTVPPLIAIL